MSSDEYRLSSAVGSMAHRIDNTLGNGDVAALRRAASGAYAPAFWRLIIELVPESRRSGPVMEQRWACVTSLLATCAGLHDPKVRAGRALAESNWSETRLVRLLEAREEQLESAIRQVGHYLASKQHRANLAELAALLVHQDGDAADSCRLAVARSYYQSEFQQASKKGEDR